MKGSQNKNGLSRLSIYLCIHIHIYGTIINKEKEAMKLRVWEEGSGEGLEGKSNIIRFKKNVLKKKILHNMATNNHTDLLRTQI